MSRHAVSAAQIATGGGVDQTQLPSFDAAALLREICVDVRRLLAESPNDHDLRHRVDLAYTEIRKRLQDYKNCEELLRALGDPFAPEADPRAGADPVATSERVAVSCW